MDPARAPPESDPVSQGAGDLREFLGGFWAWLSVPRGAPTRDVMSRIQWPGRACTCQFPFKITIFRFGTPSACIEREFAAGCHIVQVSGDRRRSLPTRKNEPDYDVF